MEKAEPRCQRSSSCTSNGTPFRTIEIPIRANGAKRRSFLFNNKSFDLSSPIFFGKKTALGRRVSRCGIASGVSGGDGDTDSDLLCRGRVFYNLPVGNSCKEN